MIFNEAFDRALWLMLLDENNMNREKILYFIKIMPDKIYDTIHRVIEVNSHLSHINHNNSSPQTLLTFTGEDGYEYLFKCKISFGKLQLSFNRCNEQLNVCETFDLSLNSISLNHLFSIDKFGNTEIGRVRWSIDKLNYNSHSSVDKRQSMNTKYRMSGISNSRLVIISEDLKGNFRRSKLNNEEIISGELSRDTLAMHIRKKHSARTRRKRG